MFIKSIDTIICMTDNQVEDMRLVFKEKIKRNSMQLPPIYSVDSWVKKEYQEFCMVGPVNESYSILNGIEEKILWEKIIKNDLKEEKFQKKQIDSIVEKVISADKKVREYRIKSIELKDYDFTLEGEKFYKWLAQFKKHCSKKKIMSKINLIQFFIEKQIKFNIVTNQELMLVGFDSKKPLYEELINVLTEKNKIKEYVCKEEKIKRLEEIQCEDAEEEIKEITKWVGQNINKKLLIISPALSKYQTKLVNELDRKIQPDIYYNYDRNNIYNSNLQRPLSNEPIVIAAINLLKLNETDQNNIKIFYESLVFNNWIDTNGYNDREKLANYINDKKIPKISVTLLIKLINNDPKVKELNLDSLVKTLSLIKKNQSLWKGKKKISKWINLTEQYWNAIKIFKIKNLLLFEINNLDLLLKSLNQIENNQIIDYSITLEEYQEILFTQLSSWPAHTEAIDYCIDIQGFEENPIRKYDAIWLMNMNINICPGKTEYNPFISSKLQKKYHIFDEVYEKKIEEERINRLKNFSTDITISYSRKEGEAILIKTPGYFEGFKELITSTSSIKPQENEDFNLEIIEDHKAPEILGTEISVSGGFRALENYQICPAWAFYENRLHANSFYEDSQEEISKMARGNIMHELLEKFWARCKDSTNLVNTSERVLQKNLDGLIKGVMSAYKSRNPYLTSNQILLESNYFKNILYQWLSFEKTKRPTFRVIEVEKKYKINIDRITFNVKIDRIDEYQDGSKVLIDYKTGSEEAISRWTKTPISNLQMPIYTIFSNIKNISAAGVAYIHNKKIKLVGLSSYGQDSIDGELKDCSLSKKDEGQWQYLINLWHEDIHKLTSGYLSGDARVLIKKENDLKYCSVKPLLRLAERRFLLEEEDE